MKNKMKSWLIILLLGTNLSAISENDIKPQLNQMINSLISIQKQYKELTPMKIAAVEKIINPIFNFNLIAKLSLGKQQWRKSSKQQQLEYLKAFKKNIKLFYINKLSLYNNQKVYIKNMKKSKNKIVVYTIIIDGKDKNQINYKFYHFKKKGWLIYDINIVGVSVVKTYKSLINDYINSHTMNELIKKLNN